MDITPGDILAFADLLADVQNEVDDMSLARTVAIMTALEDAQASLKKTIAAVKERQVGLTKEPVILDGQVFSSRKTGKWRPDKPAIRRQVLGKATHTDDGEAIADPQQTAIRTYELMVALYVSPSTEPKAGGIELLGVTKKDLMHWQHLGHEVVVDAVRADGVDDDA